MSDTDVRFVCRSAPFAREPNLFLITALRANAILVERDAAKRTTVDLFPVAKLTRASVHTTGEGDLRDVKFVFQQIINDLDHSLNGHGFFGNDQAAIGVSRAKLRMEGCTFHRILGMTILDTLFLINIENRGQQGIILTQN